MKKIRCSYIKDDGTRCQREKNVDDEYKDDWRCWQHPKKEGEVSKSEHIKKEGKFELPKEFSELDSIKKRMFLAAYIETGTILKAAEAAGVGRTSHYRWSDPDDEVMFDENYVLAFERAKELALDYLEAEARRRAVEGVREPVFYKGVQVGYKVRYSDNLLMFILKALNPDKYKDRVEQDVNGNFTHSINPIEAILQADQELSEGGQE